MAVPEGPALHFVDGQPCRICEQACQQWIDRAKADGREEFKRLALNELADYPEVARRIRAIPT